MTDFAIRFNDFAGGDWGIADAGRQRTNMWRGLNVTRYRSGLLGVRHGFKFLGIFDLPDVTIAPGPVGFDVIGDQLALVTNSRLYRTSLNGATKVESAPYSTDPATWIDFTQFNGIPYTLAEGQLYKHEGTTTTAIVTPQPLSMVVRWGYWLVGVERDTPWRLWYSTVDPAGAQPDVWGANAYLDVGANDAITALLPIFNTLHVGKVTGWWSVSGVLGDQAYVRELVIGNGPIDPRCAVVTTDNRVAYYPYDPVPALYTGAQVGLASEHRVPPGGDLMLPTQTVMSTSTGQKVIYAADRGVDPADDLPTADIQVWDAVDNSYERHRFRLPLAGVAPSDPKFGYQMPEGVLFFCTRVDTIGNPPSLVSWPFDVDRPARSSDPWGEIGDGYTGDPTIGAVEGTVELPAWYDGQGRQVLVRAVVILFRKWGWNIAPTSLPGFQNRLAVTVRSLAQYQAGGAVGDIQRWAEPCTRAALDGTDDSWRVNVGDQGWGNGFQVVINEMVGVAIREVVALVEVRTAKT